MDNILFVHDSDLSKSCDAITIEANHKLKDFNYYFSNFSIVSVWFIEYLLT